MPNKTKCSTSRKAEYTSYKVENRKEKNKQNKLSKHLKTHPNDEQSIDRTKTNYGIVKTVSSLYERSVNWVKKNIPR